MNDDPDDLLSDTNLASQMMSNDMLDAEDARLDVVHVPTGEDHTASEQGKRVRGEIWGSQVRQAHLLSYAADGRVYRPTGTG